MCQKNVIGQSVFIRVVSESPHPQKTTQTIAYLIMKLAISCLLKHPHQGDSPEYVQTNR